MNNNLNKPPFILSQSCYFCGREPDAGEMFWEREVRLEGQTVVVPQCNACSLTENTGIRTKELILK